MSSWRTAPAWRVLGWAGAALGCIAYALLGHQAASSTAPGLFEAAVFIVPMMAFGLVLAWRSPQRPWWMLLWLACAGALFLARGKLGASTQWVLLAQQVGINAMLCLGFGRTLAPGAVPLISRFARIVHGELSPRLVRYTRSATWAWVIYFALNVLVSLLLFALAPPAVWSAFVNLLSLPLLGAMFAGEFLVRCLVIPADERGGFFKSVAAYREFSARRNDANSP